MAKAKAAASNNKITFGARKGGKYKKTSGPKVKKVSKYRGQGKRH